MLGCDYHYVEAHSPEHNDTKAGWEHVLSFLKTLLDFNALRTWSHFETLV